MLTLCESFNPIVKPSLYPISVQLQRKKQRPFLYTSNSCAYKQYPYRCEPLSSSVPNNDDSSSPDETEESSVEKQEENKLSILQNMKKSFSKKEKDDLTFRQRLAKMGLAAVLSYGMVSNVSYSISVSLAWYIFSSRVRNVVVIATR